MKYKILIFSLISIVVIGIIFVYSQKMSLLGENYSLIPAAHTNVNTGSTYQGNYVYGAAMNLTWNDLAESVLHSQVDLDTKTSEAKRLTDAFNSAPFTKKDLNTDSYYVKSGYGQNTVDAINYESRLKFPDKSFSDLDLALSDEDIIAYAYFLKKVEYPIEFSEKGLYFMSNWVRGFEVKNKEQRSNVTIVDYTDDDHFVLKIKLKDDNDELYLAKGFDMNDPNSVTNTITLTEQKKEGMGGADTFEMPKLHMGQDRNYTDLIGLSFKNKGFEDKHIGGMFEKIKFDLDQKGARVENEAVIVGITGTSADDSQVKPKRLILNKPFWVVMKRTSSSRPYFVLGVNNSAVMLK